MNHDEYRKWRQRRQAAWIGNNRTRRHPDREAERLIEFAFRWAPYGGAAEEEILVHFGMTTRRFVERLWQIIPESDCAQDEVRSLASTYPHPRWPASDSGPYLSSTDRCVEAPGAVPANSRAVEKIAEIYR